MEEGLWGGREGEEGVASFGREGDEDDEQRGRELGTCPAEG